MSFNFKAIIEDYCGRGKLSEEEFSEMQTHTLIGAELLSDAGLPGEVELDLKQPFPVTPEIKGAVKSLGGVLAVEDF